MRLVYTIVLVVGFAVAAEAQGWNFSGSFNGSRNSDGTVMKAAPALGYSFNSHFQTYAGVPFYFVNLPPTTTTTTTPPTTSTTSSFVNGIGNAFLGARLSINGEPVNYSSTLELTAPTGDKTVGLSTGRATADWTNRFSHRFDSFTPFGSVGFANTISDTAFFVRPFTSLGLVSHFEGGATYDIGRVVRVGGSAYGIGAVGDQTLISKLVKRQSSATGTTVGETKVPAAAVNDHGVSTWFGVSPDPQVDFQIGYSRSTLYDFNTLFFGVGFRVGK